MENKENKGYCVHLERAWVNPPKEQFPTQRLSFDFTDMDKDAIFQIHWLLREFSSRSNGEFKYWITQYGLLDMWDEDGKWKPLDEIAIYSSNKDKEEGSE